MDDPFLNYASRPRQTPDSFTPEETRLANRNHGALLETLKLDITPTGAHYLLIHFDVPIIDPADHSLKLHGAFANPMTLGMEDILARPAVTMPVTMECGGNGRARQTERNASMPWHVEAVGTSEWTGTPLAPLIEEAAPTDDVVDISFIGADFGFDGGHAHPYGRSLTLDQIRDLDVLLVHSMNGQPLLPQHGAPLRIIVPGWYGMASVKWLTHIEALTSAYTGFQQVETYRFRQTADEAGEPVQDLQVKSLMVAPGVPDWVSRKRFLRPGPVTITGRAWSGLGRKIEKVEVAVGNDWQEATLLGRAGDYAWTKWTFDWDAEPGQHVLRCRATDESGASQPIEPRWNLSGFANNVVHSVDVLVSTAETAFPVPED